MEKKKKHVDVVLAEHGDPNTFRGRFTNSGTLVWGCKSYNKVDRTFQLGA